MSIDYNLKLKNLAWNFIIYKIGENYWLTNPKIGSRFLTNFSQIDGNSTHYSFVVYPYTTISNTNISFDSLHDTFTDIASDTLIAGKFNNWKLKGVDNKNEPMTSESIKSILTNISHVIIRNPIDRLKSGIIQLFVEWFFETRKYFLKNESWQHVNLFDDYTKQNDYDINWELFYNLFDDDSLNKMNLNLDIVNRNSAKIKSNWNAEWNKFSQSFLNDAIKTKFFEYNIDSNVHTQSFLYNQYHFLHDLELYNKIKILDLSELDNHKNLLLQTHPNKQNLINHFNSPTIKETNDVFKNINWGEIYKWIENSKIYTQELHTYFSMLEYSTTTKN